MKNSLNLLLGFALIGAIGYGIFKTLAWFYSQVLSLDPRISAALIAGVITIVATSLTITIPRHFQKKMEIEEHLRDKKSEAYSLVVEFLFKVIMGSKWASH
jgi:Trk-type K+ transport system membrane component